MPSSHNEGEKIKISGQIKGMWRDEVWRKRPDGSIYLQEKSELSANLITEPITRLLAGLMKNEPTFPNGIAFHAVGSGLVSWDTALPAPTFAQTQLVTEIFRKAPDSISYLDGGGLPTLTITNKIRVKTTFDFLDGPGLNGNFIREQGLFGGDATSTLNSGKLIDAINHVKIFKDATIRLVRQIELTF